MFPPNKAEKYAADAKTEARIADHPKPRQLRIHVDHQEHKNTGAAIT